MGGEGEGGEVLAAGFRTTPAGLPCVASAKQGGNGLGGQGLAAGILPP